VPAAEHVVARDASADRRISLLKDFARSPARRLPSDLLSGDG